MSAEHDRPFELHPRLAADTIELGDLPLCRVLLMNDARYPWLILVPRRADIREVFELDQEDQRQLWLEAGWLSEAMAREFEVDKMNLAALGNLVPQLHVHLVARYRNDAAWPAPVWGKLPAQPYGPEALPLMLMRLGMMLNREVAAESDSKETE